MSLYNDSVYDGFSTGSRDSNNTETTTTDEAQCVIKLTIFDRDGVPKFDDHCLVKINGTVEQICREAITKFASAFSPLELEMKKAMMFSKSVRKFVLVHPSYEIVAQKQLFEAEFLIKDAANENLKLNENRVALEASSDEPIGFEGLKHELESLKKQHAEELKAIRASLQVLANQTNEERLEKIEHRLDTISDELPPLRQNFNILVNELEIKNHPRSQQRNNKVIAFAHKYLPLFNLGNELKLLQEKSNASTFNKSIQWDDSFNEFILEGGQICDELNISDIGTFLRIQNCAEMPTFLRKLLDKIKIMPTPENVIKKVKITFASSPPAKVDMCGYECASGEGTYIVENAPKGMRFLVVMIPSGTQMNGFSVKRI